MNRQSTYGISWLVLLVLIYFAAFWKLDSWPVIQWDESRFAINALEMEANGKILVPMYEGEADLWNSKPPLTAFSQSFWMSILGPKELAVRLPSALAALLTLLLLAGFSGWVLEQKLLGMLAICALLASPGYWGIHIARTGDADALLVWWQMVYIFAFFAWLQRPQKRFLWLFAAGLLLAGLTKGIAAYLPLPALGIFALLSREGKMGLKNYRLYMAGSLALGLFAAYYVYRNYITPGYIEAVQYNEWGGRLLREAGTGQAVSKDGGFFIRNLISHRLFPWVYFLPFAVGLGFLSPDRILRFLTLYLVLIAGCLLFILSFSKTQHAWYDAPLYPVFALLLATGCLELYRRVKYIFESRWAGMLSVGVGLILFAVPYYAVLQQNNQFERVQNYEAEGKILMHIDKHLAESDTLWVVKPVDHIYHWDQILFYQKSWKNRGGPFIQPLQHAAQVKPGFYLSGDQVFLEKVKKEKAVTFKAGWRNCELLLVK